jgi:hypothetical protein
MPKAFLSFSFHMANCRRRMMPREISQNTNNQASPFNRKNTNPAMPMVFSHSMMRQR